MFPKFASAITLGVVALSVTSGLALPTGPNNNGSTGAFIRDVNTHSAAEIPSSALRSKPTTPMMVDDSHLGLDETDSQPNPGLDVRDLESSGLINNLVLRQTSDRGEDPNKKKSLPSKLWKGIKSFFGGKKKPSQTESQGTVFSSVIDYGIE